MYEVYRDAQLKVLISDELALYTCCSDVMGQDRYKLKDVGTAACRFTVMEPEIVAMLVTRNNKSAHRAPYHKNFKNHARVSCHATKAYLTGLSCHSIDLDICLFE